MAATSARFSGSVDNARPARLAVSIWRAGAHRLSCWATSSPQRNGVSRENPSLRRNSGSPLDMAEVARPIQHDRLTETWLFDHPVEGEWLTGDGSPDEDGRNRDAVCRSLVG